MKKVISILAIILLAIVASPFLLFGVLLVLGGALGVVLAGLGLIAVVVTWLLPFILCLAVVGGAFWLFTCLTD